MARHARAAAPHRARARRVGEHRGRSVAPTHASTLGRPHSRLYPWSPPLTPLPLVVPTHASVAPTHASTLGRPHSRLYHWSPPLTPACARLARAAARSIDRSDIGTSITCLPVYIAGCQRLVVLRGPSLHTRLWCVVEVRRTGRTSRGALRVCARHTSAARAEGTPPFARRARAPLSAAAPRARTPNAPPLHSSSCTSRWAARRSAWT